MDRRKFLISQGEACNRGTTWPSPAGMERSGIPVRVHGIGKPHQLFAVLIIAQDAVSFLEEDEHFSRLETDFQLPKDRRSFVN